MPTLNPVRDLPEPAYPPRWVAGSARLVRRAVVGAAVSVTLGLGGCTAGAGDTARDAGSADASSDGRAGERGDAGLVAPHADAGHVRDGAPDAGGPGGVMASSALGRPLVLGLGEDERRLQAPPRPPSPPPVIGGPADQQPPQVWVPAPHVPPVFVNGEKPKPPEVQLPPIRTGGVAPVIRMPGRRGGH